jgi:hypothetical protein
MLVVRVIYIYIYIHTIATSTSLISITLGLYVLSSILNESNATLPNICGSNFYIESIFKVKCISRVTL